MLLNLVLFSLGLAFLIKSANWLVEGASSIASRFNINPIVIGLTVVAFGTSAPELVVSLTSAINGNTDIALGNIIGSNIANILLILGVSSLIAPLVVHRNTVWKEIPMSFLGAFIMLVLGIQNILDDHSFFTINLFTSNPIGSLTFSNGIVLLSFFVIFLYYTFGIAKVDSDDQPEIKKISLQVSSTFVLVGLFGLMLGSKLLVDNATVIAKGFGVSDAFIGLTLVAVGTSLPELVTSVVASMKGKVELAVGNVVGSNIFNIFFILGVTSLVKTIPLNGQNLQDILVLFAATLLLFVSLFVLKKHTLGKIEGIIMLASYFIYVSYLVVRQ